MKTTKEEQLKVSMFISQLQDLNSKGLIKLMELGSRPDLIEVDGVDVIRGEYVALGYYKFNTGGGVDIKECNCDEKYSYLKN